MELAAAFAAGPAIPIPNPFTPQPKAEVTGTILSDFAAAQAMALSCLKRANLREIA